MEPGPPAPLETNTEILPFMNPPKRNWKDRRKEKDGEKGGEREVSGRFVRCHIRSIRNSNLCYGNPPFPRNLLGTLEESFGLCTHDCTICAGLIEWQKTQLIPTNGCSINTHTHTHTPMHAHTGVTARGQDKSLMLGYIISYQLQPHISDLHSSYNPQSNSSNLVVLILISLSLHKDIS